MLEGELAIMDQDTGKTSQTSANSGKRQRKVREAIISPWSLFNISQTSSTVDLGAMTALHSTMIRKLKSCDDSELAGRHVDMSAVLADIERSQTQGGDGKDV